MSATNLSSIFFTSLLKISTSRQQSSGRRSLILRQLTTAFLAFSTSGGRSLRTFLSDNVRLSFAMSSCTFCEDGACRSLACAAAGVRLLGRALEATSFIFEAVDWVSDSGSPAESLARTASRVSVSRFWILSSSAATRSAMCSSRVFAREKSVWGCVS
jgi:hypothetical protein